MSARNKEMQLRKTCQLYAYVLTSQNKDVPQEILECAQCDDEYDNLIDCVALLAQEIKSFDTETYDRIVNNPQSAQARNLAQWWEMYQLYIPLQ